MAFRDPATQRFLLRACSVAGPALALLMVVLHALHGLMIDRAARRHGSRKRGRGLRFGLYACGWDLVTLPLGLIVVALGDGPAAAGRAAAAAVTTPSAATRAYLGGFHALDRERAQKAARRAGRTTAALGCVGLILLAWVVVAAAR
jgi:hypothetical protein